ncbi:hypothetical protein PMSD_25925 [Paenibacillus macquariensis subsp. defensor]|nr:hypothetical protein PMSD_25925 [Paenibacillus macquariensis subsp. defensor]
MVNCRHCNNELPDNSIFCNQCGGKVIDSKLEDREEIEKRMAILKLTDSLQKIKKKKVSEEIKMKYASPPPSKGSMFGCLIAVVGVVLFVVLIGSCNSSNPTTHKDFKDITNKEMDDFLKWDQKQQEKKRDSELFFK